jgi:hypothetical protein
MSVLLEDRNAVVYGAGGSVGRAVALNLTCGAVPG